MINWMWSRNSSTPRWLAKKIKKYIFKNIIIGNCVSRYYLFCFCYYLFLNNRTNASLRKNILFFFFFIHFVLVVLSHSIFYPLILKEKSCLKEKIEDEEIHEAWLAECMMYVLVHGGNTVWKNRMRSLQEKSSRDLFMQRKFLSIFFYQNTLGTQKHYRLVGVCEWVSVCNVLFEPKAEIRMCVVEWCLLSSFPIVISLSSFFL